IKNMEESQQSNQELYEVVSQLAESNRNFKQHLYTLERIIGDDIPDFLVKLRLYLQNQGVDLADNARGPLTGRDVAIGYLRG
ncbi:23609_t:CDS:2, partial [Gigaspora rosea]